MLCHFILEPKSEDIARLLQNREIHLERYAFVFVFVLMRYSQCPYLIQLKFIIFHSILTMIILG